MESRFKTSLRRKLFLLVAIVGFYGLVGCSSGGNSNEQTNNSTTTNNTDSSQPEASNPALGKGVGPVTSLEVGAEIDQALVTQGKNIFESKCAACHKFDQRYVGPALAGVTERRKPEWIMNMILNPAEMTQKDETAKELLGQFMTQMPNQNLTREEARAVLEYFRSQGQTTKK